MLFLAGPRQVGKTTLARSIYKTADYLNWDIDADRSRILAKRFRKAPLWIFDELHKYRRWRNYLKGIFDQRGQSQKILVTGSARLDILRKGGDSLQGRYYFLRLMPLSFAELKLTSPKDAEELFWLSGFPEPCLGASRTEANRWSRLYRQRVVREELSSQEQFQDLGTIEVLYNRLPDLVGGLLSVQSLSEDLQVSHKTLQNWLNALERLYALFYVPPFGTPRIKAVKKRKKIYFFDWNAVLEEGSRFENFVAVHLLKWIFYEQDVLGRDFELRFYRDKYNREVDFVITERGRPVWFLEAKLSEGKGGLGVRYLKSRYPDARATVVYLYGKQDYVSADGIEHSPVYKILSELM